MVISHHRPNVAQLKLTIRDGAAADGHLEGVMRSYIDDHASGTQ